MSRRGGDASLFVGRLSKTTRNRDLEDLFEQYGRLARCDIKYGAEMAYAFVDFEDRRDAEDAVKYENGRSVCGSSIIVEWAKGSPRRPLVRESSQIKGQDECYKCHRAGHWARDCPDDRHFGYRRRRSPDVRRDRRSRSRSRDRKRRRSRSRSYEKRRDSRSRSKSPGRQRRKRSPSRSRSRSASASPARNGSGRRQHSASRSPSPKKANSKSKSRSPGVRNSRSRSRSVSRGRSRSRS